MFIILNYMSRAMRLTKKLFILIIVFLALITMTLLSCFNFGAEPASIEEAGQVIEETAAGEDDAEEPAGDEFDLLLESEDFMEMFNSFYYPDSEVMDAKFIEENKEMIFLLLEAKDDYFIVEDFYKSKKVQSIWSRDLFFEKSSEVIDEEEADPETVNILISKFTYSSKEKDKIVDVLVKNLEVDRTQIMITYWSLQ